MFPLVIPILGAAAHWLLRRRGLPVASYTPSIVGAVTLASLLVAGPGGMRLWLWWPGEATGEGMAFRLDGSVLPYALLAAAILGGGQRLRGDRGLAVLRLAVVLGAILADSPLTTVLVWSLLAVWSNWERSDLWQLAALAPLFAAAAVASDPAPRLSPGTFLALAALLRGRGSRRPYLDAIPAYALLARTPEGGPGALLLGAGAIVAATLGGRRWMAPGLIGFALVCSGLQGGLAPGALLASAVVLVVAGSAGWASGPVRAWTSGLLVGALPMLLALQSGSPEVPLLLIPAAALLAAPILSLRQRPRDQPTLSGVERIVSAGPVVVSGAILVLSTERFVLSGLAYAAAAIGLALLMAAGPRWLYRQPAYVALAENLLRQLGAWLIALLEALTALVRGINGVLEGESSTVWLFLILLIVAQSIAA